MKMKTRFTSQIYVSAKIECECGGKIVVSHCRVTKSSSKLEKFKGEIIYCHKCSKYWKILNDETFEWSWIEDNFVSSVGREIEVESLGYHCSWCMNYSANPTSSYGVEEDWTEPVCEPCMTKEVLKLLKERELLDDSIKKLKGLL